MDARASSEGLERQVRPAVPSHLGWMDVTSVAAVAAGVCLWIASWLGLDPTNVPQQMDFRSFHFPSILAFARKPLDEAMVDYPAAPFPLFYVLGGALYRVSHSILALRLWTVALGLGVVACVIQLARSRGWDGNQVRLAVAATLISPYFRGQSVYANTDILAILLALAALHVFGQRAPSVPGARVFAALGLACTAVYTRQFYVFLPAALLVRIAAERPAKEFLFAASFCGMLATPVVALVVLWRGVTPPGFRQHAGLSFVDSVPVVIALMGFYLLPLVAVSAWRHREALARDVRRPAFVALLLPLLAFAGYLIVLRHQVPDVVGGGLPVHLLQALPLGEAARSALFAALVVLGGAYLAYLFLQDPAANVLLLLIAACFTPTSILYQRYFDPLLPIVGTTALSVRELSGSSSRVVCVLFVLLELGVTAIGAVHYGHLFAGR